MIPSLRCELLFVCFSFVESTSGVGSFAANAYSTVAMAVLLRGITGSGASQKSLSVSRISGMSHFHGGGLVFLAFIIWLT